MCHRAELAAMNLEGWLRSLGLEQYEPAFRKNKIDESVLPGLTNEGLLSMSETLSDMISEARKPAAYATLKAALYLRLGAASRKRSTSSGLRTTGNFLGCGTREICWTMSNRCSVTLKKNRNATMTPLMLVGE